MSVSVYLSPPGLATPSRWSSAYVGRRTYRTGVMCLLLLMITYSGRRVRRAGMATWRLD